MLEADVVEVTQSVLTDGDAHNSNPALKIYITKRQRHYRTANNALLRLNTANSSVLREPSISLQTKVGRMDQKCIIHFIDHLERKS